MNARWQPKLFWASLIAVGTAYEVRGLTGGREGYTFSETVRATFRVNCPAGKIAFAGGWVALSAWFVPHIIARTAEAVEVVVDVLSDS